MLPVHTKEGITTNDISLSRANELAMSSLLAISWWICLELFLQIHATFRRRSGIYYWSLSASTVGCFLHALGFFFKFFTSININISLAIIELGWPPMLTGQALVLWSRLHLVTGNRTLLRCLLAMIIVNAIILHIPVIVITWLVNTAYTDGRYNTFNIYEKVQMTIFPLQELILSSVYIVCTLKMLRPTWSPRVNKTLSRIIWINVIAIGFDIALILLVYCGLYNLQSTIKAFLYAVKLRLEFPTLNKLRALAKASLEGAKSSQDDVARQLSSSSTFKSWLRAHFARKPRLDPSNMTQSYGDSSGSHAEMGKAEVMHKASTPSSTGFPKWANVDPQYQGKTYLHGLHGPMTAWEPEDHEDGYDGEGSDQVEREHFRKNSNGAETYLSGTTAADGMSPNNASFPASARLRERRSPASQSSHQHQHHQRHEQHHRSAVPEAGATTMPGQTTQQQQQQQYSDSHSSTESDDGQDRADASHGNPSVISNTFASHPLFRHDGASAPQIMIERVSVTSHEV